MSNEHITDERAAIADAGFAALEARGFKLNHSDIGVSDLLATFDAMCAAAQPVGEPVAWMLPRDGDDCAVFREPQDYPFAECGWTPLYTTPQPSPERVPMTDEQIDKLKWGPHEGNPITFAEGLRDFARAVEAHHGITTPKTDK